MQNSPLSRHAIAAFPAVFLTITLLYAMHALVTLKPMELAPPRPSLIGPFVRIHPKPAPPLVETRPEPIPKPLPTPTTGRNTGSDDDFAIRIPTGPTAPPGPGSGVRLKPSLGDAPLVNIMRVLAAYPGDAIARQLEGYVTVEFDVAANGRTTNHRIVESTHRVFEKNAIKAAAQFRYQARTVDGEAVVTEGVRARFRFELDTP